MQKGFTLIELLVVIAIIGVLSSIILKSLSAARVQAIDAKKQEELQSLRTDLELYKDTYGTNPINRTPCCAYEDTQTGFLQELVDVGYLQTNIKSPTSPDYPYLYYDYGPGNNIGMVVVTWLEGAPPSMGYPGTCRPFAAGTNWCDQASDNWYCLCNPY